MGSAVTRAQAVDVQSIVTLLDASAGWQRDRGIDQWVPNTFADEVRAVIEAGDLYVMRRESTIVGCFMLESHCPEWLNSWPVEHVAGRRRRCTSGGWPSPENCRVVGSVSSSWIPPDGSLPKLGSASSG
jgi:hypothetical protein